MSQKLASIERSKTYASLLVTGGSKSSYGRSEKAIFDVSLVGTMFCERERLLSLHDKKKLTRKRNSPNHLGAASLILSVSAAIFPTVPR